MYLKKGQLLILILNLVYLIIFSFLYTSIKNYEFIIYVGVIVFFFVLILATNRAVKYPNIILWGLSLWGFLHMLGGILPVRGARLYDWIIIPISEQYQVFRYDQFIHILGFAVATLLVYHLIKTAYPGDSRSRIGEGIVIIMAGLGVGALNEVMEFTIQVIVPETGIGGYINTSLDLVSDFIGALLAWLFIKLRNYRL